MKNKPNKIPVPVPQNSQAKSNLNAFSLKRRRVVAGASVMLAGAMLSGCGVLIKPGGMTSESDRKASEERWRQALLSDIQTIAMTWPDLDG